MRTRAPALALALAAACAAPADRRPAVWATAAMAGLNDPNDPSGDSDNLAAGAGGRLPVGRLAVRPEVHAGDHSVVAAPAVTWEFGVAGSGPGAIDGHVGVGWTFPSTRADNVLGDTASPLLRVGAEGYLVGGLLAGAALLAAPWGYDHDDPALAGIVYFGVRLGPGPDAPALGSVPAGEPR